MKTTVGLNRSPSVIVSFAVLACSLTVFSATNGTLGPIEFRCSPPWWQTAICLPDDPDKILAGREGQLLLDFGGGGPRNFGICLQGDLEGGTRWLRQETLSARAPIVRTFKDADGVELTEEAFVIVPAKGSKPGPPLVRTDGANRLKDWAQPARTCASAFKGVDVGWDGQPIQFRLTAVPKVPVTIVFGLCEGWHKTAAKRPLILAVKGGESRRVDPVADFGANQPGLYKLRAPVTNGDRFIEFSVSAAQGAEDRNAIVNAIWVFEGALPPDDRILSGQSDSRALATYSGVQLPERQAAVLMTLKNRTAVSATARPRLRLQSVKPVVFSKGQGSITVDGSTCLLASERIESFSGSSQTGYVAQLPAMTLPPGALRQVAFTVERHGLRAGPALTAAQVASRRDDAHQWWEKADLPFATIQVPDPGVQAVIESAVRNIWQAREIKQGQPAFHVGPTVYRGLWVVDGSFLLESAAILGRAQDARAGIEYLLSFQKPDGSFELMHRYWKENGIVLWAATRHARLMQDRAWLASTWPKLERTAAFIHELRRRSLTDEFPADHGLNPPGEIDGGLSGAGFQRPEYSNVYWNLTGLKAFIEAARWLGKAEEADQWQKEYDDLYATFRKAADKDLRQDGQGHTYLPVLMGHASQELPQRAQWAFCHAVYPGRIFAEGDALVTGNLAMLQATEQEGMVFGTGWMVDGIWTYFASFYAHAWLWQGRGHKAAEVLYAFADHASPTRVWREEQKPLGQGSAEVGDMPHNWASAEFIRLTAHLIELDRGDELHLLEGFPSDWARAGMVTRLNGVLTPFGPLHLEVHVSANGQSARVKLAHLPRNAPSRIVLHLDGLSGRAGSIELPADRDVDQTVARYRTGAKG